ncbi:YfjI family protein [Anatilimnocola sp. NA78]|uniref:YfjI family protein n=1 Tax=Anatilimnocola sp. NA78 TaxID=3415683 RepID=UPI003CE4ADAE
MKVIAALRALRSATGVYFTVNPANPALLARANNRLRKAAKGDSTSDKDILTRRWLLVDTDPIRPSGISATDEEHEAALARAREISEYLQTLGWPAPILADSGNGGHLMFRVDLPVEDGGLVERCLATLDAQFSDKLVSLDQTVHNPARIWKLYGTLAAKGDSVPDRPHRIARILSVPGELTVVSEEQLSALAGPAAAEPEKTSKSKEAGRFDLEAFIKNHQLDVSGPEDWNGKQGNGRRWTFNRSPLCDHNDSSAFLLEHRSGAISAGCHHNSCSWNWSELRKRLDPVSETRANVGKTRVSVTQTELRKKKRTVLEPYQPFPTDALPKDVGSYVHETATSIGCDDAFIALPVLASLARAVGNTRVIRLKHGWTEPAVVWAAIVGKSGTHKTPAIQAATQFLNQRQQKEIERFEYAQEIYERDLANYERDFAQWKRTKGGTPPPEKPREPVLKRFIVSDITIEAMADRLSKQFDGVLVVRDELAGWVNGIGEYKGAKSSDNGHWLAMWSAAPMTVDRKTGEKKTLYIPRAAVSVVGGIQPGILRTAMGKEHMQDGMCARLLLAMPDGRKVQWTERTVPLGTSEILAKTFDRLISLEPAGDEEGRDTPFVLAMTPEAKTAWVEYYDRHRDEQVGLDGDLAAAWSKLEAYTARFALLFQLCAWAAGDEVSETEVDEVSMRSAIAVSDWFGGEARRVYAVLSESDEARSDRELLDLIRRKGGRVTARDLKASSRRFASADEAEAALLTLVQDGLGRWDFIPPGSQGGRPTCVFQLLDSVCVTETP